ncbi:unnamed protein product [Lactuca saligna]|uniref:Uncharacterized protein n=1 Tax=Lactuca saligna TaxID=75948 RepID=A0AA35ZXN3_LACSI|nr:unnamed protein product [Lactuca saligna]
MSTDVDSLTIDVYHQAVFCYNPFVYFHHKKVSVTNLDICNMDFKVFKTYLDICNMDVYYCSKNRSLVDGLRELRDEEAIDKEAVWPLLSTRKPLKKQAVRLENTRGEPTTTRVRILKNLIFLPNIGA